MRCTHLFSICTAFYSEHGDEIRTSDNPLGGYCAVATAMAMVNGDTCAGDLDEDDFVATRSARSSKKKRTSRTSTKRGEAETSRGVVFQLHQVYFLWKVIVATLIA